MQCNVDGKDCIGWAISNTGNWVTLADKLHINLNTSSSNPEWEKEKL